MNSPLCKQPHSWHCLLFTWKCSLIPHTQTSCATVPCSPHPTRALRPHSRHLLYLHGPPQPTWDSVVSAGHCRRFHLHAVLTLLMLWHLLQASLLGGAVFHFAMGQNPWWAIFPNASNMEVLSHLFGLWHLHLTTYSVAAFPLFP